MTAFHLADLSLAALVASTCLAQEIPETQPVADPTQAEVPLPAVSGWKASLVIDNVTTGIWTVGAFQVFDQYACPEVVGLDDLGRCHVLVSYSGKWTPTQIIHDGKWLGGLAHGDIDPRTPGVEIYTGGQLGNLYQVTAHPQGALDCRLIAYLPGREIHTIVAGQLDLDTAEEELLVFTRPGGLFKVKPTGEHGRFEVEHLQDLPGRVRDAVLVETSGGVPAVATVSRAGRLQLLCLVEGRAVWTTIHDAAMGMGRIAQAPYQAGRPIVLYTTHDDGRILRHEGAVGQGWRTETIHLGAQGPRGIAAGRFHEDPEVETVAIFGYSKKVQLLTRTEEHWQAETLFEDRDKGHWLAAAELDGRNNTQELLISGYGARIILLSRPPGYGLRGGDSRSGRLLKQER